MCCVKTKCTYDIEPLQIDCDKKIPIGFFHHICIPITFYDEHTKSKIIFYNDVQSSAYIKTILEQQFLYNNHFS